MSHTKSVLIVDDNVDLCTVIREALTNKFVVSIEHDGISAMERFDNSHFDIVILDIDMPGVNGIEVLKRIKSVSSVPVVMMTGTSHSYTNQEILALGAAQVLMKPFRVTTLYESIERAMSFIPSLGRLNSTASTS